MLKKLKLNLQEFCQMDFADRLLVGVSGGPDSLTLLLLLYELGIDVVAAHVNHQLRPEADDEERGVQSFAEAWKIPFVSVKVDVDAFAKHDSLSIEEAARKVRYRYLFEQAVNWNAKAVAVAHTADDQVETLLMHLLRGSGLQGLSGMKWRSLPNEWSREIPLVRPMLSIWRTEVMDFLAQKGIQPYWDRSNLDERYFRNRIRNHLIPYLESFNPAIRKTLWQTCDVVQAELELLENLEVGMIENIILEKGDGFVEVSRNEFQKIPLSLKRRMVRRIYKLVLPEAEDLEYQQVKRILESIDSGQLGLTRITETCCLLNEAGRVFICNPRKLPDLGFYQVYEEECIEILIPGKTQIGEKLFIVAELIKQTGTEFSEEIRTSLAHHAWIDFDRVAGKVYVRTIKPGDRFAPFQMGGHQTKISDIYVNRKIPKRYRLNYPIVCDEERVIWIPGYTISHNVRVDSETRCILHMVVEQG